MKQRLKLLMETCNVAFSMYSAIPMPHLEWSTENMRYAMCFFPLVGVVEAAVLWIWVWLAGLLANLHPFLFAVVATAIPIVLSGGIHLDGFCDTVDALSSHQSKEKKLEILKDPHMGAFSVMGCILYLMTTAALWVQLAEAPRMPALIFGCGFVLSRALSGLSVVTFPCAKFSGLAAAFSGSAEKKKARLILVGYLMICAIALLLLNLIWGSVVLFASLFTFFYYYRLSQKEFGGITGDLAGYFLQCNELILLFAVTILSFTGR